MEKEIQIKSDRYGYVHKFVQVEDNIYKFVPEKEWMPIYINYNDENIFIDTDGGPYIGKGWSNGKIIVNKITYEDETLLFYIEKVINN